MPLRARRLQRDALLDTPDGRLVAAGTTLRVRDDGGRAILTYKGPLLGGPVKAREEIETAAGDPAALLAILAPLGFTPTFRYEKFREEFSIAGAIVAVDETPIGAFIEIEGEEAVIHTVARQLGFSRDDYVTGSYRSLFLSSTARPAGARDMIFTAPDRPDP